MKPFIPIEKQSKKVRREYHKRQRRTWGAISPVTRRPPDPRAYQRKKIHMGEADERSDVDFFIIFIHNLSSLIHCIFIAFSPVSLYTLIAFQAQYGGALVSTGLLRLGKRVVDLVGHLKKRETQVIAKPQLIAA